MLKKRIFVIHTGGTISMQEDKQSGAVKPTDKNPLVSFDHLFDEVATIVSAEPFHLPSPHITPKEMLELKNLIEQTLQKKPFDGVVITHGTDTLEETAYFLDLTLTTDVPVVVTGAMRSSNEIGADGLYNLISSVRVAACSEAKGKGVMVVLNDEIHSADNVTKTHTSNISTFQSPQYGPIGIITKRKVLFHHEPAIRRKIPVAAVDKRVALIKAYAGMDSYLLSALKELHYDGVVIEALGQGNLPPAAVSAVKELINEKIPVVLVSRCFNGIVQDIYGYEGGGKQLKELGVIFSNGLNGQKARLKLLIALGSEQASINLEALFES
ncbi:L-asparaginase [Bacillus wudalianchiensis]|uniref:asparaginase n=1 Tax=Pseudobacillus wudalianchiensis TaxID=1743143 RepID=A0A1B9B9G2_9BACI|nr:asparaginase [Bacillus wudalianchiensis]OCA92734.1 L-asparaginase [Bacillus wudalianchiensis]